MGNKEVKLFGYWLSPVAQRVKWALKLKGVEYEYIEEDIFNKSPLIWELNHVYGKVPVLVHDGKALAESLVILEYIDETWKQTPLLPEDPYERANVRFWTKFVEEKLLRSAWEAVCSEGDEQGNAVKSAIEALEKIEGQLKGKKFFGGEKMGFLDIAAAWISYDLPIFEEAASVKIFDPSKFPAMAEWTSNFLNHPIIKDSIPPKDVMLTYFAWRGKQIMASRRKA